MVETSGQALFIKYKESGNSIIKNLNTIKDVREIISNC